jgi:hypothetical protein
LRDQIEFTPARPLTALMNVAVSDRSQFPRRGSDALQDSFGVQEVSTPTGLQEITFSICRYDPRKRYCRRRPRV